MNITINKAIPYFKILLLLSFMSLFLLSTACGSGSRVLVRDKDGIEVEINEFKLRPDDHFLVKEGSSNRLILTKEVAEINITSKEIEVIDGIMYYEATLELLNQTHIKTLISARGQRVGAYVKVQDYEVLGDTPSGKYQIPLKDVARITFYRKDDDDE